MNHVTEQYDPRVEEARASLRDDPEIAVLFEPGVDPRLLTMFLIRFCSMGPRMTEPVEGWIRRAGERCIELGIADIGKSLITHANHEAGHDLMMHEDTRALVAAWNTKHEPKLDAEALLAEPATKPALAYTKLHEDTIASTTPYCQCAIECEIERLSVLMGRPLLEQCKQVLGPEVLSRLSFLVEHAEIDAGHTLLNEKMIGRLIAADPSRAEPLARAGSAALRIYGDHLKECLRGAAAALAPAG